MIKKGKIIINGVQLSVSISGTGPTILFVHGTSTNSGYWFGQLTDTALTERFQMIAFDLPGHGESDWCYHTSMYQLKELAALIEPILRHYEVNEFILVGLSLGSVIIGEIETPIAGCRGICLPSACIVNDQSNPSIALKSIPKGHVFVEAHPSDQDLKEYAYGAETKVQLAERYIEDYRKTDPNFRMELGKIIMNGHWSDELENIRRWKVPVCIVYGTDDPLANPEYLKDYEPLWRKKVHFIENAGHLIPADQPNQFNQLLIEFADEVLNS